MNIEIIGFLAGTIGVVQSVPQIIKVYDTKSAKDLSWITLIMLQICLSLWTYYGYVQNAPSIMVCNIALMTLYFLLIALKLKYDKITS